MLISLAMKTNYIVGTLFLLLVAGSVFSEVDLEYIGHASFVVTSPAGVRVKRDASRRVLVFRPSRDLEVWSEGIVRGWQLLDEARSMMSNHPNQMSEVGALVRQAAEAAECIVFKFNWARVLAQSGDAKGATAVLETALARSARGDWHNRMEARSPPEQLPQRASRQSARLSRAQ